MKVMKSFSSIWKVSKNMYFNFGQFSFRASFTYVGFVFATEVFMLTVGRWLPIPFGLDNPLTRYIVIPFGIAYVMDKKTFDGKKPYNFLKTMVVYWLKPKYTYLGKAVKFQKMRTKTEITTVRSSQIENSKKGE